MFPRLAACLFLAAGVHGCVVYEYEHEFWLKVDGSGTVYVTGRPELWAAFKNVGDPQNARATVTRRHRRSASVEATRRPAGVSR